jgi:hypothetical protein
MVDIEQPKEVLIMPKAAKQCCITAAEISRTSEKTLKHRQNMEQWREQSDILTAVHLLTGEGGFFFDRIILK